MKLCFTAAYEGRVTFKRQYRKIIKGLKSIDPLLEEWIWEEKRTKSRSGHEEVYRGKINRVKRADVLVTEISHPSVGVGCEIFYALGEKKQVLALYSEGSGDQASETVRGIRSRYLTIKSYNLKSLPKIIKDYFREIPKKLEVKFNCILPPRLDSYLKARAGKEKKTKSAIVRSLIEREMKKDPDLQ